VFLPTSFAVAFLMTIVTTICWGSWANTFKGTRGYRFELFYWDYALGVTLVAAVLAFTMGSLGSAPEPFLGNLAAASGVDFAYALAAGAVFNVANLLLVAGIDLVGLAIAFPIAIGIALVEGVLLSYWFERRGSPVLLAVGVALAIAAVLLDARAYWGLPGAQRSVSRKGIVVNVVSGLLMGLFAPLVARALHTGHPLTPYSISVFFALGALACCFVVNVYFMRHPLVGVPVAFKDYFVAGWREHALGLLGGVIWGLGTTLNFAAAGKVGVAIAYAIGQAAPMIAAFWGVVVWREFAGAGRSARVSLAGMFVCYLAAIACVSLAYG
jgi:glucose uptake protein